jgi:hypothetical protein
MSESHWARELSVVLCVLFLVFAYAGLKEAFGQDGEVAVVLLAMSSSIIYYGTEIRMYALVLVLSAFIFFAVMRRMEGWYRWVAYIAIFVLPSVQYFAGMATVFFPFMYQVYWTVKERCFMRYHFGEMVKLFIAGLFGCVFAFFTYALPQMRRISQMWLPSVDISYFPSTLISSMLFMQDSEKYVNVHGWFMIVVQWILIVMYFAVIAYVVYLILQRKKYIDNILLVLMGMTALFSLFWLVVMQLWDGMVLYHHRYFLVLLWMFAAMTYVLLVRWVKNGNVVVRLIVVGALFLVMFGVYVVDAHYGLAIAEKNMVCDKDVQMMIVHKTPFSLVPFQVYARENGCLWRNVLSTNMTVMMGNSMGFDIIKPEDIYWNDTLPNGEFWYVNDSGD